MPPPSAAAPYTGVVLLDPQRVANGVNSLWRYRPGGHPEEKGTKKIAEQTNFYDLPELDPTENDIEQIFSEIERTVAWDLKTPFRQDRAQAARESPPRRLLRASVHAHALVPGAREHVGDHAATCGAALFFREAW